MISCAVKCTSCVVYFRTQKTSLKALKRNNFKHSEPLNFSSAWSMRLLGRLVSKENERPNWKAENGYENDF